MNWIKANIQNLEFDTALDAFGGTGCVSHTLKDLGKEVTYNDALRFNYYIGLALIENDKVRLSDEEVEWLLTPHDGILYPTFMGYNMLPGGFLSNSLFGLLRCNE